MDQQKDDFEKLIRAHDCACIFLHDHPAPDPDCIGAAQALVKLIVDKFDKPVSIYGIPPVHTQNKMMCTELEVTIRDPRKEYDFGVRNQANILVDCTAKSGSIKYWEELKLEGPHWTIDHHCDKDASHGKNVDMAAVGSTCTIITEYLQAFNVEFSLDSKEDIAVATGMMLGLMTDTDSLLGDNVDKSRDIPAFLYLKERYDPALYNRLMRYDYPAYCYECFNTSSNNKIISEPLGIYSLGFLKEERAGAISQIADLWIRRERLHIVVVFAFVGKELVASVRTKNGGGRASDIAKILFPDSGAGGGKAMAGATVALHQFMDPDLLTDEQSKQELLHITMSILVARAKKTMDLDE